MVIKLHLSCTTDTTEIIFDLHVFDLGNMQPCRFYSLCFCIYLLYIHLFSWICYAPFLKVRYFSMMLEEG